MKRQRSAKTFLLFIFCVQLVATIVCFVVCGGYTLYTSQRDLMRNNQAALDIYLNSLVKCVEDLQEFNENIFAANADFLSMSLDNYSSSSVQGVQHMYNLQRLIQSQVDQFSGVLLFSTAQEETYYWFGDTFLGGIVDPKNRQIMQDIRTLWSGEHPPALQNWISYQDGDTTLLINAFKRRNLYICAMVDVGGYAQRYTDEMRQNDIELAFITRNDILTNTDHVQAYDIGIEDILDAVDGPVFNDHRNILQTRFDENVGIGLCGMISLAGVWSHLQVYVIMLVVSLVIICALFISMYQLLQQMLVYPLNQITDATRRIAEGACSIRSQPEKIEEFQSIQTALGQLVEQKVSLARENMNQVYQKEHALLQYYQLQTRSHFILNCMKSIYGLTLKGNQEQTMRMITLFSNHLRYIYHDSLSLVTLRSEMEEVKDYYNIIALERSNQILLNQNIDPDLLEFEVPPLIIQTFLENFNKHNAPDNKILRFSVRVDKVCLEEKEYVRIRMTDNGVGYSAEALQALENMDSVFGQHHVGVQNLCRRMDIVYHKQYKKAFLNNPGGGALSIFYLPLEEQEPAMAEDKGGSL